MTYSNFGSSSFCQGNDSHNCNSSIAKTTGSSTCNGSKAKVNIQRKWATVH